ncbi:hypothetical protein ACL02R_11595 [Streptomyces sp. MS19]|uniref:hypothetical protein n=1 Tax=Streptomyces sp. MS19 TaxID=3385972 RepID=UPI0039A1CC8C
MTHPPHRPAGRAEAIAWEIDMLTEQLLRASPQAAVRVLATVLDTDNGVLGRMVALLSTSSRVAHQHAAHFALPERTSLALGRAANKVYDIALDLNIHAEHFAELADTPPPPAPPAPPTGRHR